MCHRIKKMGRIRNTGLNTQIKKNFSFSVKVGINKNKNSFVNKKKRIQFFFKSQKYNLKNVVNRLMR